MLSKGGVKRFLFILQPANKIIYLLHIIFSIFFSPPNLIAPKQLNHAFPKLPPPQLQLPSFTSGFVEHVCFWLFVVFGVPSGAI
jgi:hypothetical protein